MKISLWYIYKNETANSQLKFDQYTNTHKLLHQSFCNTYIVLSVQYIKCKIYIITDNSMSFITPV